MSFGLAGRRNPQSDRTGKSVTDTADPLLSSALHPLLAASNCLLMALDRLLNGRKQLMEAAMEIRRHLHNETSRAIGGFLGFAQCLLRPNVVTAVGNVFLIRLASLVLVDVPAMKCPRCEGSNPPRRVAPRCRYRRCA